MSDTQIRLSVLPSDVIFEAIESRSLDAEVVAVGTNLFEETEYTCLLSAALVVAMNVDDVVQRRGGTSPGRYQAAPVAGGRPRRRRFVAHAAAVQQMDEKRQATCRTRASTILTTVGDSEIYCLVF